MIIMIIMIVIILVVIVIVIVLTLVIVIIVIVIITIISPHSAARVCTIESPGSRHVRTELSLNSMLSETFEVYVAVNGKC